MTTTYVKKVWVLILTVLNDFGITREYTRLSLPCSILTGILSLVERHAFD